MTKTRTVSSLLSPLCLVMAMALFASACGGSTATETTPAFDADRVAATARGGSSADGADGSDSDSSGDTSGSSTGSGAGDAASGSPDDGENSPAEAAEPTCERQVVKDEYGFSTTIEVCSDGSESSSANTTVASFNSMEEFRQSPEALDLVDGFRDRFIHLSGCTGRAPGNVPAADPQLVANAARAVPDDEIRSQIVAVFGALVESDAACESGNESAWVDAYVIALTELQNLTASLGTVDVAAELPSAGQFSFDAANFSASSTAVVDEAAYALADLAKSDASTAWFSSSHLAHTLGTRQAAAAGDALTTAVLGSSLTARGFDPVAADVDGLVSLAMPAATQPAHAALFNWVQSDPAVNFSRVIWAQSTHSFFRPCQTADLPSEFATAAASFTAIDSLASIAPTERLTGSSAGSPAYAGTALAESATSLHGDWDRGATRAFTGTDADRRDRQVSSAESIYAEPVICEALINVVETNIVDWADQGIETAIVVVPISDDLAAFHPDGRRGHAEVTARLKDIADRFGAKFVDHSESVGDPAVYYDLTHLGVDGRSTFTNAVVATLGEWGWN